MRKVRVGMYYEFEYDEYDLDGYAEEGQDLTKEEMIDAAIELAQDDMYNFVPEVEVSYWEE